METRSNEPANNEARAADGHVVELAYASGSSVASRRARAWVVGAYSLVLLAVAFSFLFPLLTQCGCGPSSERTVCAANLRGIAQALYIYADDDPHHMFPDDVQRVIDAQNSTPKQFICPSTAAGRQHYYYVPGHSMDDDAKCVLMLEDPRNHDWTGGNVVYLDGSVEFVEMPKYRAIMNQVAGRAR